MIASHQYSHLTPDEYLQLEENSSSKHEYINGNVYAMAGATDAPVTIAGNIFALLLSHLRGSGCRVYIAGMKVRIESKNRFYYPDVMVTCDQQDRQNSTYKLFPRLIIEVLSDSTEAFDRGDKFADYQCLETLEEYILINSKKARIECFFRGKDGFWLLKNYTRKNSQFQFKSIEFTGNIIEVYEEVDLPDFD